MYSGLRLYQNNEDDFSIYGFYSSQAFNDLQVYKQKRKAVN